MIPDPRCDCRTGHDVPAGFVQITYNWELGDSRGIIRLSIDPQCPLHAEEYLDIALRKEDEILQPEPPEGKRG